MTPIEGVSRALSAFMNEVRTLSSLSVPQFLRLSEIILKLRIKQLLKTDFSPYWVAQNGNRNVTCH